MEARGGKGRELVALTGCDSGIGACLRDALLGQGYAVLTSYLEPPSGAACRAGEFPVRLDLREDAARSEFAGRILGLCRQGYRLHALVHNAGIAAVAPLECLSMEKLREVFEVNFFGSVDLTRRLIPELIQDAGRVVFVGSAAGRVALPYFIPYSASKFALVGLADALRRELAPQGVRVILAEPRAVATPIWDRTYAELEGMVLPGLSERYRAGMMRGAAALVRGGRAGLSPEDAAAMIASIVASRHPRARYTVSRHRLLVRLQPLLPRPLADRIVARLFSPPRDQTPKPAKSSAGSTEKPSSTRDSILP